MLTARGKSALGISSRDAPSDIHEPAFPLDRHSPDPSLAPQTAIDPVRRNTGAGPSGSRHGLLMQCAANYGSREARTGHDAEHEEAERISRSVLRSLEGSADLDSPNKYEREMPYATPTLPALYATYPPTLPPKRPYLASSEPTKGTSPPFTHAHLVGVPVPPTFGSSFGANTVPYDTRKHSRAHMPQKGVKTPPASLVFSSSQMSRALEQESDFRGMCEHIWRYNDQKTSLYLQERLRCCVPGEYEQLVAAIFENVIPLMVHRFGNFLVQCMLQLAKPHEVAALAQLLEGHIAELAKDQFCCHVIQKLLDVSSVVIQATVAAELLDDVVDTMCSSSGTHVWQKLLHLPWKYNMPHITVHANNAVHLPPNKYGWLTIARTEAGCATIKSFLGVSSAGPERQQCLDELIGALSSLLVDPVGSVLVVRIAMIAASRARVLTTIFANAYEYSLHPIASGILITLIHSKIPSFPSRLASAVAPFRRELYGSRYGRDVLTALDQFQGRN